MINLLLLFTSVLGQGSQTPELGKYFGFNNLEIIKIGSQAGPMYVADMNSDGLMDILVVNNRKSRIDLMLQKKGADPNAIPEILRPNEIPEHWRFKKKERS